jgi:topoisomerase-4 subunit B
MATDTRRLIQLTLENNFADDRKSGTLEAMDLLLAKNRAPDRKKWLETAGNLADFAD